MRQFNNPETATHEHYPNRYNPATEAYLLEEGTMLALLVYLTRQLRHRWHTVRATRDAGYSTEAVVVTAVLVALALLVLGIIAGKVVAKATDINLG